MSVSINGTNGITFNNSSTSTIGGIGDGQTWQNLIASRALATTYTNSTGKPIFLQVSTFSAGDTSITVTVNGLAMTLGRNSVSGGQPFGSVLIPNGATYNVSNSGTLGTWYELR